MNLRVPLTALVLCVLAAGCGQDPYSIERDFFHVQKRAAAIFQNPEGTPPADFKSVIQDFNRFQDQHPNTNIAVSSQFSIVQLYVANKEYDKAREQLAKISAAYAQSPAVLAEAAFMRGTTYEAQKDWDSALAQYQVLIRTYPTSARGLEAPMYIAAHYKNAFQPDKMIAALRDAVVHYQAFTLGTERSALALQAQLLIARCYAELKEWDAAVSALKVVIDQYQGKIQVDGILLEMANIYERELKDVPRATEVLNRIIREYPKTRSGAMAKDRLENLTKGKI